MGRGRKKGYSSVVYGKQPHIGVTEKELRVLELVVNGGVAYAAEVLGTNENTIYSTFYRLRERYRKALAFCGDIRAWKRRLKGRYL